MDFVFFTRAWMCNGVTFQDIIALCAMKAREGAFSWGIQKELPCNSVGTYVSFNQGITEIGGPFKTGPSPLPQKKTRRGQGSKKKSGAKPDNQIKGTDNLVINISSRTLSVAEHSLLQKGLSFCPSYRCRTFDLDMDLQRFFRQIRLKAYFATTPTLSERGTEVSNSRVLSSTSLGLRLKSHFRPPQSSHAVETFIGFIQDSFSSFKEDVVRGTLFYPPNLSVEERHSLRNLQEDKSIIFKPADKDTFYLQDHVIIWKRYIDDVFCIWHGSPDSLKNFFEFLNVSWPGIKFTINTSQDKMNFLDTLVIKDSDGRLSTDLYFKDTDRNSLLHYDSLHPPSTKRSIPRAQYHRVQRIVSNTEVRESRIEGMTRKFLARGYPPALLENSRTVSNTPKIDNTRRIPFVHRFHPSVFPRLISLRLGKTRPSKNAILSTTDGTTPEEYRSAKKSIKTFKISEVSDTFVPLSSTNECKNDVLLWAEATNDSMCPTTSSSSWISSQLIAPRSSLIRWKFALLKFSVLALGFPQHSMLMPSPLPQKKTRRGQGSKKKSGAKPDNQIKGTDNLVINISSRTLSVAEHSLLQKGLSFCPSYRCRTFDLDMDLQRFFRQIRLKAYFATTPTLSERGTEVSNSRVLSSTSLGLRLKSHFRPPQSSHAVETFIGFIQDSFSSFKEDVVRGTLFYPPNLSVEERHSLRNLQEDKSIIFKPADKDTFYLQDHVIIWKRYIDDVFCIWHGSPDSLKNFFEFLNVSWPGIKFTINTSQDKMNFLDTLVIKDSDGKTRPSKNAILSTTDGTTPEEYRSAKKSIKTFKISEVSDTFVPLSSTNECSWFPSTFNANVASLSLQYGIRLGPVTDERADNIGTVTRKQLLFEQ
ncbi:unnamed protein product [Ranitomeya imitator]|uniref:Helix-turn-helix domain-containing protein n=1 Tax=Ranitomeya imitator TaxID=111125 RepID=A0ABN9L4I4_9NEOB|nr:unnamed protein product [Ranitomeya imitator]